ncbi:uncharacterized protein [Porites lutea]|uniref:uncharacterized protein n=1 Tax=Porites lutea TaxID=51062 RepID=UPI003CC64A2D
MQTCYDECLRTLGKKDLTTEKQKKSQVFQRFKRAETVQKTCEVKPSLCQEDKQRRVNAIPANNITITFHKLRDTGRFYANVLWTPPPGPANFTGYRLIYIMGRYWDFCCRDVNKTTTSAIVDRFTKGLKGNEFFRVKVSLEKSTNVKETFAYMELLQHFMSGCWQHRYYIKKVVHL